ncbi:MAG: DUF2999 family protein [Planctomycetes bacterium]|nr:DUF2999 family protein [Planctomycetota bacterium]
MSELKKIFTEAGVEEEQLRSIVSLLKENPMGALLAIQQLQLPEEVMQKIMSVAMSDPASVEELAKEMGLTEEDVESIKTQLNPNQEAQGTQETQE